MSLSIGHRLLLLDALGNAHPYAQLTAALHPSMWLPGTETSGTIATNAAYTGGIGAQLVTDPEFENWTGDNLDNWTENESPPNSEITRAISGDLDRLVLTSDGTLVFAQQTGLVSTGDTIRVEAKVDAISGGNILIYGATSDATSLDISSAGTFSQDTISNSGTSIGVKRKSGTSPTATIDYVKAWKVGELDGLYGGGQTFDARKLLSQPAIGFTVGTGTQHVQLPAAGLEAVFNPSQGTIGGAIYLTAANWNSATVMTFSIIGVDANNYFFIYKSSANTLRFQAKIGGGATQQVDYAVQTGDKDAWLLFHATWENGVGMNLHVKNSVVSGAYSSTGWTASDLTAAFCRICANGLAAGFIGQIGQYLVRNVPTTAVEVATLYNAFKAQEPNAA